MSLSSYISSILVVVAMFWQLIGRAGLEKRLALIEHVTASSGSKTLYRGWECLHTVHKHLHCLPASLSPRLHGHSFPILDQVSFDYPGNPIPTPHDSVYRSLTTEWSVNNDLNGNELGIIIQFLQVFDGSWGGLWTIWAYCKSFLTWAPQPLTFTNFY